MKKILTSAGYIIVSFLFISGCSAGKTNEDAGQDLKDSNETASTETVTDSLPDTVNPDKIQETENEISQCPDKMPSCLDKYNNPDLSLCPVPQADYECVDGCCKMKFKSCKDDAECAAHISELEKECPDKNFACMCSAEDNWCHAFYCVLDDDCKNGDSMICSSAVCVNKPETGSLRAKLLNPPLVLIEGNSVKLLAEAFDKNNPDTIVSGLSCEFEMTPDDGTATVTDGILKAGSKEGKVEVRARIKGFNDSLSDAVPFYIHKKLQSGQFRVITVDHRTKKPVEGNVAIESKGSIFKGSTKNGIFLQENTEPPVNVHFFSPDHEYVSVIGFIGTDILIPVQEAFSARLKTTQEGKMLPEEQEIENADIITGSPDMSQYPKLGEFELTVTGFGFSSQILAFDFTIIIGPNVEEYFHPDTILPVDKTKPAVLPGGLTLMFGGSPVVTKYYLAAPQGIYHMWSIGGRVTASEIEDFLPSILGSIGGDKLDMGALTSAVLPLFKYFYSGIKRDVVMDAEAKFPPDEVTVKEKIPMSMTSSVILPKLPETGTNQWVDGVILLAGLLLPDGIFLPLGLTAGADKMHDEDIADGIVDGDWSTPEVVDPLKVYYAGAHSGLQGAYTKHALFAMAVSLSEKSSGSGMLFRSTDGGKLGKDFDMTKGFMKIPVQCNYAKETRKFTIDPVSDIDLQRIMFKYDDNRNWTIYLASGITEYTVPLPETFFEGTKDRTIKSDAIIFNAFRLNSGMTYDSLLKTDGQDLDLILLYVDELSFVNL